MKKIQIAILLITIVAIQPAVCQGLQNEDQSTSPGGKSADTQPKSMAEIRRNQRKEPRDWKPSMIKLSYDLVPAFATVFGAERTGQGFQASIDFDQFFFTAEYGQEATTRGENFDYESSGNYFSFGPEVNFLKKNTDGHGIVFGLRYGHASFEDALSYTRTSDYFGDANAEVDISRSNPNLKANWMELTLGLTANVWKDLYMGYTVRYKVLRQVKGIGEMAPYDVTGFGLYEDNTGVRFNYYIGWAIRWRDKFPDLPVK